MSAQRFQNTGELKEAAVKLGGLFSFCGGPLFIADLIKPSLGSFLAFLVTFVPMGLMIVGAFFMDDDPSDPWSRDFVQAGLLGLFVVLGMQLFALWCFVSGIRVPDQGLHMFGIAVGAAWSAGYLWASRRWSDAETLHTRRAIEDPIEPS